MNTASASEMEGIDNRTEVVIFHDLAEVVVDNSKSLVWVGTQTFTIRHLDDEHEQPVQVSSEDPPVTKLQTIELGESQLKPAPKNSSSVLPPQKKKRKKQLQKASSAVTVSPIQQCAGDLIDLEKEISGSKISRFNNNVECIDLNDDDEDEVEIADASDNTMQSSASSSSDSIKPISQRWPAGRRKMPHLRKPSNCDTWCSVCCVDYGSEDNKFRHLLTHFGINPERCPRCRKFFSQSSTYYGHKCSHNALKKPQMELPSFRKNAAKIMECSACRKSFPGIYKLKRHEISHTGEKPYKCCVCHRAFTQCTVMSRHNCPGKKIPLEKINPSCDICGKIFRSHKFLKIHRPIHMFEGRSDVDEKDIDQAFANHHMDIGFAEDASEFLREMFG